MASTESCPTPFYTGVRVASPASGAAHPSPGQPGSPIAGTTKNSLTDLR